jgi:hypothetical protein
MRRLRINTVRVALVLATLALYAPRGLMPEGFMPGMDHAGRPLLVFCDPELRAAFGGHVHTHGHGRAGSDLCPFGMSGGAALIAVAATASTFTDNSDSIVPAACAPLIGRRTSAAHGARAPPVA